MNGPTAGFALLALIAFAGDAQARPSLPGESATAPVEAAGLRLAQAREVEIYYDRYGRQVVVDAYTGEVIAVGRPRGAGPDDPAERRRARARELRGDGTYERRIPLGEMLRRELEAHVGNGEDDPYADDPDYRSRQRERFPREGYRSPGGDGYPADRFPDAPMIVAPPQGDRWGPDSRVPALVVSPFAKRGNVDHTFYDTTSILRFITRLYDLPTLEGIAHRNAAFAARGAMPPGDLTKTLSFA